MFPQCPTQAKDGNALIQLEQAWAQALEARDADAVGCILADEFQDADPSGQLHDRAETLAQIPHRRPGKNILSELTPHVFGDFGYIRGLATLVDGQGRPWPGSDSPTSIAIAVDAGSRLRDRRVCCRKRRSKSCAPWCSG